MTRVFGDTFYFLALLNSRDPFHGRAITWSQGYTGRLVTTEWVMTELADGLASSSERAAFSRVRHELLTNPLHEVIPLGMPLYEDGIRLYDARPDKDWSLTDCISFVVMRRESIAEALTGDRHFEQAGFIALLK